MNSPRSEEEVTDKPVAAESAVGSEIRDSEDGSIRSVKAAHSKVGIDAERIRSSRLTIGHYDRICVKQGAVVPERERAESGFRVLVLSFEMVILQDQHCIAAVGLDGIHAHWCALFVSGQVIEERT
jgi:hypothetical protein